MPLAWTGANLSPVGVVRQAVGAVGLHRRRHPVTHSPDVFSPQHPLTSAQQARAAAAGTTHPRWLEARGPGMRNASDGRKWSQTQRRSGESGYKLCKLKLEAGCTLHGSLAQVHLTATPAARRMSH